MATKERARRAAIEEAASRLGIAGVARSAVLTLAEGPLAADAEEPEGLEEAIEAGLVCVGEGDAAAAIGLSPALEAWLARPGALPPSLRACAQRVRAPLSRLDVAVSPATLDLLASVARADVPFRARAAEGIGPHLSPPPRLSALIRGGAGSGRSLLARVLAGEVAARIVLRVWAPALADLPGRLRQRLRDLDQWSRLHDAIVFLDDVEALAGPDVAPGLARALVAWLDAPGPLVVLSAEHAATAAALRGRVNWALDLERDLASQPPLALWESHLPPDVPLAEGLDLSSVAHLRALSPVQVARVVQAALALAQGPEGWRPLDTAALREAALAVPVSDLEGLTRSIRPAAARADLVLPAEAAACFDQVAAACRSHEIVMARFGFGARLSTGKGLVVLFDGPPGTGKTFAAEVLAAALGEDLHRVDVPAVLSKWVGETEKNIQQIFARARATRALLLFDEADSLFARRSGAPQTASDRHANVEVNQILQEIDRHDGIVILTTNLYGALDDALRRRVLYRLTFPFPDAGTRARLYRTLLPPEAPVSDDVDVARLGRRFEIAGGHIKNAVLRAAYDAAGAGEAITMARLVAASEAECFEAGVLVRAEGAVGPSPKGDQGESG